MKPCFAYTRVSTQKQGEGVSLEAQRDAISAYARQNNLTVTEWFEEKETAAKSGRPVFNEMLKRLKKGQADGLIIHKIDRSARNLRDWAAIHELADAGREVFFATETLDFNSRGGRLTADIQAVIAADYIRNLREETIKGIKGRLKQGLYPFAAPIGYLDRGAGKPKEPDPKTAPLVTELFELYASGQYTFETLRREMFARGLCGRTGKMLSLCGTETILKNPFYTGVIEIKRTGDVYQGKHAPLITTRLFKTAQEVRLGRRGPITTEHRHLFRRLFRCGMCGGPMVPEKQKGHVYYRCKPTACPTKTLREDVLDEAIRSALASLEIALERNPDDAAVLDLERIEEQRKALDLQLRHQRDRLDKLSDLLLDGVLDPETFKAKTRQAKLRIKEIEEMLHELPDLPTLEQAQADLTELQNNLCLAYDLAKDDEKRQIVELAWPNRKVIRKNVELEPYSWLTSRKTANSFLCGAPDQAHDRTFERFLALGRGILQRHKDQQRAAASKAPNAATP